MYRDPPSSLPDLSKSKLSPWRQKTTTSKSLYSPLLPQEHGLKSVQAAFNFFPALFRGSLSSRGASLCTRGHEKARVEYSVNINAVQSIQGRGEETAEEPIQPTGWNVGVQRVDMRGKRVSTVSGKRAGLIYSRVPHFSLLRFRRGSPLPSGQLSLLFP